MASKAYTYYKKNVPYYLTVRMSIRDNVGKLLTTEDPFVAVDQDEIRDFKLANKRAIIDGLILPADEPALDWETPNTLTDEEILNTLKSYLQLRSRMSTITSVPIIYKFLNKAKETNKSEKILQLIKDRLEELDELIESPSDMRGVDS